jgi:S-disulfanyl-L-cysteine oxidoreductase SoxD
MSKLLLIAGTATAIAVLTVRASGVSAAGKSVVATGGAIVAEPSRSVWDSVYTDSQAVRGDSLYKQTCVKCHGATLTGTNDGTPLAGADFLGNWNGLTAGELYEKIRTTMPPDKPKSIARPQLAELVAYIFAQNHFPAGAKMLTDDADSLKDIKIVQTKP